MQIFILLTLLLWQNLEVSSDITKIWGERKPDDELFFSQQHTYELTSLGDNLHEFFLDIPEGGKKWPYDINMISVESYERDWISMNISVSTDHKSANVIALYEDDWGYSYLIGVTQEIKIQVWRTWRQCV